MNMEGISAAGGEGGLALRSYERSESEGGWRESESNRPHADFQSAALPTELSRHYQANQLKHLRIFPPEADQLAWA